MPEVRMKITHEADYLFVSWTCPDREVWEGVKRQFLDRWREYALYMPTRKCWRIYYSDALLTALRVWAVRWDVESCYEQEAADGSKAYRQRRRTGQFAVIAPKGEPVDSLWLLPDAPAWAIEAMYKAAALRYHPDTCREPGTGAMMKRINAAAERLRPAAKIREHVG